MKQLKTLVLILVASVAVAVTPCGARAAGLQVRVDAAQAAPGAEVEVPIHVKGATNLGALELVLTYDAAVIKALRVEAAALAERALYAQGKVTTPGRVPMGLASGKVSLHGDGVVFTVRFRVQGQTGQKSPLKLEFVRAWQNETSGEMLVDTQGAEFLVTSGFPWLLVLAIVGGGVVLLALLMLLARRRRPAPAPGGAPAVPRLVTHPGFVQSPPTGFIAGAPPAPAGGVTFKHQCGTCGGVLRLPQEMLGRQFVCAACSSVQVGGQ